MPAKGYKLTQEQRTRISRGLRAYHEQRRTAEQSTDVARLARDVARLAARVTKLETAAERARTSYADAYRPPPSPVTGQVPNGPTGTHSTSPAAPDITGSAVLEYLRRAGRWPV